MKVGLIRCLQTEDMCPATTCIKVMDKKVLAFKGIEEDIELEVGQEIRLIDYTH